MAEHKSVHDDSLMTMKLRGNILHTLVKRQNSLILDNGWVLDMTNEKN